MTKTIAICIVLAAVAGFACFGGYAAPSGSLYSNTVLHKGDDGLSNGPTAAGPKTGEACATAYLGIFSTGDAGVKAAAAAGGVTTVHTIDYRNSSILGSLVQSTCTLVNGQ